MGGGGGGVRSGGRRSEVFVKCQNLKKKNVSFPAGFGGQGRCEQRSEVFVKI